MIVLNEVLYAEEWLEKDVPWKKAGHVLHYVAKYYFYKGYPVAKIADCNSVTLETSLVRLQPGSPKIVRLFPTPLYKGSCTGK